MGQQVLAVVYGVAMDALLFNQLREDPADEYSDLDVFIQDFETGAECDVLGISVGTSIYAEDGERELPSSISLQDLWRYLEKEIAAAKKRWRALAAHCRKYKGVTLPEPELLLASVERA